MAYRINDLMINIASGSDDDDGENAAGCPGRTCLVCTITHTPPNEHGRGCWGITEAAECLYVSHTPKIIYYALCAAKVLPTNLCGPGRAGMERQLPLLKEQLREALSQIEREESASRSRELETVAEVENLEEKLQAALVTLGRQKAEMKRKKSGPRKTSQKRKKTQKRR